jgi:hypothetical protein
VSKRSVSILGPLAAASPNAPTARLAALVEHLESCDWTVHRPFSAPTALAGRRLSRGHRVAWRAVDLMRLEGDVRPSLARRACREASSTRSDVTLVSMPPFSGLAVALAHSGAPRTVLDFRDVWLHNARLPGLNALTKWVERRGLRQVNAITYAGAPEFGTLLGQISGLPVERVVSVPNGVLPHEVPSDNGPPRSPGPLRLVFAGSVYGRHQLRHVARAVGRLGPERVRLEVIGPSAPAALASCLSTDAPGIAVLPALPRRDLYRRIQAADVAVIALADSFPHDMSIPVKAYEYFALGMPTLAIAPPTSALLGLGSPSEIQRIDANAPDRIEAALGELAERRERLVRSRVEPALYDRRIGLERLHDLLERVGNDR